MRKDVKGSLDMIGSVLVLSTILLHRSSKAEFLSRNKDIRTLPPSLTQTSG